MVKMYLALLLPSILACRVDGLELWEDGSPPVKIGPKLSNAWKDNLSNLEFKILTESDRNKEVMQRCFDQLNLTQSYNIMNITLTVDNLNLNPLDNINVKACLQMKLWDHAFDTDKISRRSSNDTDDCPCNATTRIYDPGCRKDGDCLFNCRDRVRQFPSGCYFSNWTNSRSGEFQRWWAEVYGDLMYTFDYVLFDPTCEEEKLENQFWHIILFLKTLVLNLPNPFQIISVVNKFELMMEQIKSINTQLVILASIFTIWKVRDAKDNTLVVKLRPIRSVDNSNEQSKDSSMLNNVTDEFYLTPYNNTIDSNNVPDGNNKIKP